MWLNHGHISFSCVCATWWMCPGWWGILWLSWWIASDLFFFFFWKCRFILRVQIVLSLPQFILHLELDKSFPTELFAMRKRWLHGISLLLWETCQNCWWDPDSQEWCWWPASQLPDLLARARVEQDSHLSAKCLICQLLQHPGAGKVGHAAGHPCGSIHATGSSATSAVFFLLQHSHPNIGNLKLSVKPKSFFSLVSEWGRSKTNEPITSPVCYLLRRTAPVMRFVFTDWVPESCYGITAWCYCVLFGFGFGGGGEDRPRQKGKIASG